jgi:hypothetical protein
MPFFATSVPFSTPVVSFISPRTFSKRYKHHHYYHLNMMILFIFSP